MQAKIANMNDVSVLFVLVVPFVTGCIEDRITALEAKVILLEQEIAELKGRLNDSEVAFSARTSAAISNMEPWQTVIFGTVLTNKGNSYFKENGTFVAPRQGMYVLFVHIMGSQKNNEFSLHRNGEGILYLYTPGTNSYGTDANSVVLELNQGDEIKVVKHGPWGESPFYIHHTWSTFSGYMLYTIN